MLPPRFRHDRRSSVALLFAIMAIPIAGIVGLAIDYAFWNQTYASMSLAANGAALNAVKTASTATLANDPNAVTEGVTAGKQWFIAQLGTATNAYHENVVTPSVTVTTGATTAATVQYTGTVPSIFGTIFGVPDYPISLHAQAEVVTSPYLNVEILLDNSPSMEIGATPGDIQAMMAITPCSVPGAVYNLTVAGNINNVGGYSQIVGQSFNSYQCSYGGYTYDGTEACPISGGVAGITGALSTNNYEGGPVCSNLPKQVAPSVAAGQSPLAGPPCAFACHQDTTLPLSASKDYYGVARSTIGKTPCFQSGSLPTNCAITLRFDLVKTAVNQVIDAMESDNIAQLNNLNVGIFTFDQNVNQVYPVAGTCGAQGSLACQAGDDWSAALTAVGVPPKLPNTQDTGILPYDKNVNGGDTNLPNVLTNFASYLTPAGNGSLPSSPLKVLFLVTDGLADYGPNNARTYAAIDPTQCDAYKDMGYTVYVLYTPYYPLMNYFYLGNIMGIAEPTGTGQLATNLQQCASDPVNDYIEANPTDTGSINAALQTFLKRALTSPARFTQ